MGAFSGRAKTHSYHFRVYTDNQASALSRNQPKLKTLRRRKMQSDAVPRKSHCPPKSCKGCCQQNPSGRTFNWTVSSYMIRLWGFKASGFEGLESKGFAVEDGPAFKPKENHAYSASWTCSRSALESAEER